YRPALKVTGPVVTGALPAMGGADDAVDAPQRLRDRVGVAQVSVDQINARPAVPDRPGATGHHSNIDTSAQKLDDLPPEAAGATDHQYHVFSLLDRRSIDDRNQSTGRMKMSTARTGECRVAEISGSSASRLRRERERTEMRERLLDAARTIATAEGWQAV